MKKILVITLIILGTVPFGQLCFSSGGDSPLAKRYISLAPSTTEILFALGLDQEIVGVSSYCNYPEQVKDKTVVGDFSYPNLEKILSLKPDYVFCTGLEQAPVIDALTRLRLKVYCSDPKNIAELTESILEIGKITHRDYEAQILARQIEDEIAQVGAAVKTIPAEKRPKVFLEIWHDPLTTAGKGSIIDELITLAGGINIASDTLRPYSIFSPEEVIKRNPDCIILTYMEKEQPARLMERRFGWDKVSALKNNRVYNDIDPNLLLRPGPRVAQGVKAIYQRLYPEKNAPAL